MMKMKKRIFTAAIALAAICGLSASAQKPDCAPGSPCDESAQQCRKTPGQCDSVCDAPYCEVFAGLNLTDSQKSAIKKLNGDRKAARQKSDKDRRETRRQARRDYFDGVKKVLTPDQYVQFLETIVIEQPAPMRKSRFAGKAVLNADGPHRMHGRHDGRAIREAKAVKADRPCNAAACDK